MDKHGTPNTIASHFDEVNFIASAMNHFPFVLRDLLLTKQQLSRAQADLELAVEALEFYAEEKSWIKQGNDFLMIGDSDHAFRKNSQLLSGGKRARQTLKQIKEKKE